MDNQELYKQLMFIICVIFGIFMWWSLLQTLRPDDTGFAPGNIMDCPSICQPPLPSLSADTTASFDMDDNK